MCAVIVIQVFKNLYSQMHQFLSVWFSRVSYWDIPMYFILIILKGFFLNYQILIHRVFIISIYVVWKRPYFYFLLATPLTKWFILFSKIVILPLSYTTYTLESGSATRIYCCIVVYLSTVHVYTYWSKNDCVIIHLHLLGSISFCSF